MPFDDVLIIASVRARRVPTKGSQVCIMSGRIAALENLARARYG